MSMQRGTGVAAPPPPACCCCQLPECPAVTGAASWALLTNAIACPALPACCSNSPERDRPGLPVPHKRRGRSLSPAKRHGHGHSSSGAESGSNRGGGVFRTRSSASSASAAAASGEQQLLRCLRCLVASGAGAAPWACLPAAMCLLARRPGVPVKTSIQPQARPAYLQIRVRCLRRWPLA